MNVSGIEAVESTEKSARHIQKVREIGWDNFETQHKCKDGRIIDVEISVNYLDAAGGRLFAFIRDVTERKLVEEELREHRDHLEELVEERTAELARNYETQGIANSLLHLSLEEISIDELLDHTIGLILSIPMYAFESKGAIFLVEDEPDVLVLRAQKGLLESLKKECGRVPFGKCVCGRAASTREIQFADYIDDRHEIHYEGVTPHGHYCVPIMAADKILGVLTLYIKEGHRRDQKEEEFLSTVADTLAGIIMRKRVEKEQIRLRQRLEALWEIARMVDADYQTLCDHVQVEITAMTQSRYAFFGFLNEDESVMTRYSCSKEVMDECRMQDNPIEFPIGEAGLWGDAVRERRTLIINDYQAGHPSKKGLPKGHVPLTRILVVPIFSHDRIVSLVAVANKSSDYTEEDVEQINAFVTSVQAILEKRQTEEALRESELWMRSIFKSLGEAVLVLTPDRKLLDVNQTTQNMFGYSRDELRNLSTELLHVDQEHYLEFGRRIQESFDRGEAANFGFEAKRKDGEIFPSEHTVSLLKNDEGQAMGIVSVVRDISERKQAEEELTRL